MLRLIAASFLTLLPGLAFAQGGSCITQNRLRVEGAFSRIGSGGTFDYSVQVNNISGQPVAFRVTFRMTNAQVNPMILNRTFTLPANGNPVMIPLGSGTEQSASSRIAGGVILSC